MMYEQDPETSVDHMSMEPNFHYAIADYNHHSNGQYELTQAALALTFEQRTANLIELYKLSGGKDATLGEMIQKRLGL